MTTQTATTTLTRREHYLIDDYRERSSGISDALLGDFADRDMYAPGATDKGIKAEQRHYLRLLSDWREMITTLREDLLGVGQGSRYDLTAVAVTFLVSEQEEWCETCCNLLNGISEWYLGRDGFGNHWFSLAAGDL